ncbi:PepSY-associated TM helix domain-containing protein [Thalassotalea ganghwensis]
MIKTWLRRIHLSIAIFGGIFLLNISLSGALLLYGKSLQSFFNPQHWLIHIHQAKQPIPLSLTTLVNKVAAQTNERIKFIQYERQANKAWLVALSNNQYLNINPYTGEVLLTHNYFDSFYGFIMAWHRWLVFETSSGERPFKLWVSIASLLFIIEVILGCYLWCRHKNRFKRLKVKWRSKPKIFFNQLHTSVGVICCIPLFLIAFSGIAFHWQAPTQKIIEWLTFSQIETANIPDKITSNHAIKDLNEGLSVAKKALKNATVYRVYLPTKLQEPLKVRLQMPSESHAYSWAWVDTSNNQLIGVFDASQANLATKIWHFKYKFHIGEFIGWPIKIIWLFLSLLPSFFVISGFYLLYKRKMS